MKHLRTESSPRIGRRTLLRALGGAAGYAAVSRFAPLKTGEGAAAEVQLAVGTDFLLRTLDPGRTIEVTSLMVDHALYDTLVTFEGDRFDPKPSLATKWTVSSDGKAYTFFLRPNVRFASGNELTSADVKWSIDRVMNLVSTNHFLVEGVDAVLAPSPDRVVIQLKQPQPGLLAILAGPELSVLDSQLLRAHGADSGPDAKNFDRAEVYLNGHSAGSGPFVLESYLPNQQFVLRKNPGYWRGPARIDRVTILNHGDAATQALELKRGDLDIALNILSGQVQSLQESPDIHVKTSPTSTIFYVELNNSPQIGGAFANPTVQEAIRYALDYDGLLAIAGPGAQPLAGLLPGIFRGALNPDQLFKTDRAKAKALIAQTGLANIRGRLSYYQATLSRIDMNLLAQKIQADLATAGINIDLNGLTPPIAVQEWRAGKVQIGVFRWVADYPDPSDYLIFLPGGAVGLRSAWTEESSAAARDLVALGRRADTELNPARRASLFQQLERTLVQQGPFIPLFQPAYPYAFRSNVDGVTFNSVWGVDFYAVSKKM